MDAFLHRAVLFSHSLRRGRGLLGRVRFREPCNLQLAAFSLKIAVEASGAQFAALPFYSAVSIPFSWMSGRTEKKKRSEVGHSRLRNEAALPKPDSSAPGHLAAQQASSSSTQETPGSKRKRRASVIEGTDSPAKHVTFGKNRSLTDIKSRKRMRTPLKHTKQVPDRGVLKRKPGLPK